MKTFKALLFASVIFLCACGADGKLTATGTDRNMTRGGYSSLDAPIKIEIGNPDTKSDTIIRNGSSNVYRRSSIENPRTDTAAAVPDDTAAMSNSERAKKLSRAIAGIKGIDNATVVISGHTAIVGIEHIGHLDDMLLMKMKKEVDDLAKATDKGIRNVAVTATPELVKRVANMTSSETSEKSNLNDDGI